MVLVLLIVAFAGPWATADDWPRWRGPAGDGTTAENGWSPAAVQNGVAWRAQVGLGHSGTVIAGNRLYTIGARQLRATSNELWEDTIYCLDASSGAEIWRYSYQIEDKRWPGPGSTPLLDGTALYALSWQGHLHCLDAESGAVIWRRDLVGEGLAVIPQWGFSASPVVEGKVLLLNAGLSGLALDKRTGKVLWRSEAEEGGLASPVVFTANGTRQVAILGRDTLFGVALVDGQLLWSHPWSSYADPIVLDDRVFLSAGRSGDRGARMLHLTSGGPEQVWYERRTNYAFQSYVVVNGFAYGLARDRSNELECVDLETGEIRWSHDVGDWGALSVADGKLVLLRGDGVLVIAEADPEEYKELASAALFELEPWRSYADGRPNTCWTEPVVANGRIYARTTHGDIACVELSG
jgi:outer membrane protein assembly factor BamB